VIFMDLNMPVMDGFQSSRRIREFEAASVSRVVTSAGDATGSEVVIIQQNAPNVKSLETNADNAKVDGEAAEDLTASLQEAKTGKRRPSRSYIIALTGLSAERDREEAVACGIDAFLTKPVRFKNVGKLLEERCWVKGDDGRDKGCGV